MDESRRQFEEWWNNPAHEDLRRSCAKGWGVYIWQASRQAIEITPPEFITSSIALSKGFTVDYSNGFGDAMDAYEENILSIGLKIKGE